MIYNSFEESIYSILKRNLSQSFKVVDSNKVDKKGKSYFGLHDLDGVYLPDIDYKSCWVGYGTIIVSAVNDGVYLNFKDGAGITHDSTFISRFSLPKDVEYSISAFCRDIYRNKIARVVNKNTGETVFTIHCEM